LERKRFAYLDLALYHPPVSRFLEMRQELGVRNVFHPVARLLNPARATSQVIGLSHPPYFEKTAEALRMLNEDVERTGDPAHRVQHDDQSDDDRDADQREQPIRAVLRVDGETKTSIRHLASLHAPEPFDTVEQLVDRDASLGCDRARLIGAAEVGQPVREGVGYFHRRQLVVDRRDDAHLGRGLPGQRVHLALNVGLPVVDPTGGFYYVFLGGRPLFRKYDRSGVLQFERHIEGAELDRYLAALPTHWPTRRVADREVPLVVPAIRAAAVDARGQLWISLSEPYTYVYDTRGDKVRTVQFAAAGIVSPTSLFFTRDGRLLVTPGCFEFRP